MKKNKWLVWLIAITLTVSVAFGAIFGTIALVRASRAVLRYEGISVSEGAYSYIASYMKVSYLRSLQKAGVDADNSRAFYEKDRGDGVTYGEHLLAIIDEYARSLAVSSYWFDTLTRLTKTEKEAVRSSVDAVVDRLAEGDRTAFNRQMERYGFTYDDMLSAVTMQYKANQLFVLLYGASGQYVSSDEQACRAYYESSYVHAKLLIIRTETGILTDEHGNKSEEGLTDGQKAQRAEDIQKLDAAIAALAQGESGAMTEAMFKLYTDKYADSGFAEYSDSGWYLSRDSRLFEDFSSDCPEIAEAVMTAPIGEYVKMTTADGVCYIYRTSLPEEAYLDEELASDFFYDFLFDCATSLHAEALAEQLDEVEQTERMKELSPLSLPVDATHLCAIPG